MFDFEPLDGGVTRRAKSLSRVEKKGSQSKRVGSPSVGSGSGGGGQGAYRMRHLLVMVAGNFALLLVIGNNLGYQFKVTQNKEIALLNEFWMKSDAERKQAEENVLAVEREKEVTVVTEFFLLPRSKHSTEEYIRWVRNFVRTVNGTSIVLFTNKYTVEILQKHGVLVPPNVLLNTTFESPMDFTPVKVLGTQFWLAQHEIDPEKYIHHANLYAIWDGKSFITNEVARYNPWRSTYFIYVDIGSMRDDMRIFTHPWPDTGRVLNAFSGVRRDLILFGLVSPPLDAYVKMAAEGPLKIDFVEGGFFGGTAVAVQKFHTTFWEYANAQANMGHFIGKDQSLMNSLLYRDLRNDSMFVESYQGCGEGDVWFIFYDFFANVHDSRCGANVPRLTVASSIITEYTR